MENQKQKVGFYESFLNDPIYDINQNYTILDEQNVKFFHISEEDRNEIKQQDVKFNDKFSKISFFCFPPIGVISIISAYKMKKYYFLKDYKKSLFYKKLTQVLSYLCILIFISVILYLIFYFCGY